MPEIVPLFVTVTVLPFLRTAHPAAPVRPGFVFSKLVVVVPVATAPSAPEAAAPPPTPPAPDDLAPPEPPPPAPPPLTVPLFPALTPAPPVPLGAPEQWTEWQQGVIDTVGPTLPEGLGSPRPNASKEGVRWVSNGRSGFGRGDGVRIDRGNPNSSWPSQRVDHVRVTSGGRVIGRDGRPIEPTAQNPNPSATPEAHIPRTEYQNWRTWNSP